MLETYSAYILVLHIMAVMVAVGTVTVTDYLHILGIRDPKLERRSLSIFPYLSRLIVMSLFFIYITGTLLVINKPELLMSPLFLTKIALVVVVTINGFILHHWIFPDVEKRSRTGKYSKAQIKKAAFFGSLSVVTWYAIVTLSITKTEGYGVIDFLIVYFAFWFCAYLFAVYIETARKKCENFVCRVLDKIKG